MATAVLEPRFLHLPQLLPLPLLLPIDGTDAIIICDSAIQNIHYNTNNDSSLGLGPRVRHLRPRPAQSGEKTPRGGNWDWWWNGVGPSWNWTFGTSIANVTA
mmetsp:Transcript_10035/g.21489  ORF Transcript_10035/g.21489 Transcript_10035/m.21489 type:complete len:102 (+) Transcript_10035:284-589(+)